MVGFSWKSPIMVRNGGALHIMVNIIYWLNTTYTLGYYDGMDQISWDLWTLTLWLFGQRNSRATMTTPTHTHAVVEPKWSISDYIRKPFMNPILGALHFEHSWHVQIITLRVSFSSNAIGKKVRRIGNPQPKKMNFWRYLMKQTQHKSSRKRNKMKPIEMCTRLTGE